MFLITCLLILGIVLMVMAYFLPNRPPMNDILAVAGVIAAVIGLILLAVGGVTAVRDDTPDTTDTTVTSTTVAPG